MQAPGVSTIVPNSLTDDTIRMLHNEDFGQLRMTSSGACMRGQRRYLGLPTHDNTVHKLRVDDF
ncbi:hypothetical protein FGG08_006960 [Glutinoglossum americanum]|uniref:Uncharacterized protein n=1 Tax=Glutinoglossum americanum TaxID=1670608 RepID=A0A9P8HX88_9PEZI|nr:hypothetical protein FGG08_006960 [Glutinoglossum americanum]